MRLTADRNNNPESGVINKTPDWATLGKLVRQRAAEALSANGHNQRQDSPAPLDIGSDKNPNSC
jgi:hypothetical protein